MPQHESAAWLPNDDGQNQGMPKNIGAAHPLGPYAPRSLGRVVATAPDEQWLPSPDGQHPHAGQSSGSNPQDACKPAPPQKGVARDEEFLPSPSGQYPYSVSK